MKNCIIPLTQGQVALVSPEDYDWLMEYRWVAHKLPTMNSFRAVSRHNRRMIYMSRFILGLAEGATHRADHKNGNTLDNRRSNLRVATQSQNGMNRGPSRANKTGYKGVIAHRNGFVAQIRVNNKHKYLGYRKDAKAAYELYCAAALQLHGEFARLV